MMGQCDCGCGRKADRLIRDLRVVPDCEINDLCARDGGRPTDRCTAESLTRLAERVHAQRTLKEFATVEPVAIVEPVATHCGCGAELMGERARAGRRCGDCLGGAR